MGWCFERIEDGRLSAVKVTFGAEPKDYDIYAFILKYYNSLRFSPAVDVAFSEKTINPKRMQREIKKQMTNTGIGTKSQQALKLQHEQFKVERRKKSREQMLAEKERLFELKQQKKKEKHMGR